MGMVVRSAAPVFTDLTFIESVRSSNTAGNAAGTTFAATLPPSRQVGDLMVLITSAYNMGMNLPSTWTTIQLSTSGARQRVHAVYKRVTAQDVIDTTVSVTMTGTMDSTVAAVMLFRNQHVSAPINVSAQGGSTSSTTVHPTPTVTSTSLAVANRALRVRIVATYVDSTALKNYTWPAGTTEAFEYRAVTASDTTLAVISVAINTVTAVGAQGAVSATSLVSRYYGSITFVISPIP